MRFEAEHHFAGPPEAVRAVLTDPAFYATLELPDLNLPEVVEHDDGAEGARIVLRYEWTGHLDPMAARLLGGDRLRWTQEVLVGPDGTGALRFRAEANPDMLHGDASFRLAPEGASGSVRTLQGDLVVGIPVIGAMAERRIVPGVVARLDVEAEAVNRRLEG